MLNEGAAVYKLSVKEIVKYYVRVTKNDRKKALKWAKKYREECMAKGAFKDLRNLESAIDILEKWERGDDMQIGSKPVKSAGNIAKNPYLNKAKKPKNDSINFGDDDTPKEIKDYFIDKADGSIDLAIKMLKDHMDKFQLGDPILKKLSIVFNLFDNMVKKRQVNIKNKIEHLEEKVIDLNYSSSSSIYTYYMYKSGSDPVFAASLLGSDVETKGVYRNRDRIDTVLEYLKKKSKDPNYKDFSTFDAPKPKEIKNANRTFRDNHILNSMAYDEIKSESDLGGGVNETKILKDGTKCVWKPAYGECEGLRGSIETGHFFKREVAAFEIDRIIGTDLVPPTAVREYNGFYGSIQEFKHGFMSYQSKRADKITTEYKQRLALLDFLIANTDRHSGNFLVSHSGEITAIDNGCTFPSKDDFSIYSYFQKELCYNEYSPDMTEDMKSILKRMNDSTVKNARSALLDSGLIDERAYRGFLGRLSGMADSISRGDYDWNRNNIMEYTGKFYEGYDLESAEKETSDAIKDMKKRLA